MSVEIKEVSSVADYKTFVSFPYQLYKQSHYWVPPLKSDEFAAVFPKNNPFYRYCEAKFWLAYKDNRCVGRIGGIVNRLHNEKTGQKNARFTRLEFIDDKEVSAALIRTAETWARELGMNTIQGPLGFTNLDHQGMLVEGFDHLPSIASEYHLPYYKEHIEALGYAKEIDWLEFRLTITEIPEKALKLNEIIKLRYQMKVLSFKSKKELLPYARKLFDVLNGAFAELFSVVALDEASIEFYIKKYFKALDHELVKLVENKDGELVGFIIGMPSLSQAMQKAKGKLFPFGLFHIIKAMKKPLTMDLVLTGILPEWQGQGVSAILITEQQKTMFEKGIRYVETTGIFETNHKAIQHWKNYEHIQHKRKRCYIKAL